MCEVKCVDLRLGACTIPPHPTRCPTSDLTIGPEHYPVTHHSTMIIMARKQTAVAVRGVVKKVVTRREKNTIKFDLVSMHGDGEGAWGRWWSVGVS